MLLGYSTSEPRHGALDLDSISNPDPNPDYHPRYTRISMICLYCFLINILRRLPGWGASKLSYGLAWSARKQRGSPAEVAVQGRLRRMEAMLEKLEKAGAMGPQNVSPCHVSAGGVSCSSAGDSGTAGLDVAISTRVLSHTTAIVQPSGIANDTEHVKHACGSDILASAKIKTEAELECMEKSQMRATQATVQEDPEVCSHTGLREGPEKCWACEINERKGEDRCGICHRDISSGPSRGGPQGDPQQLMTLDSRDRGECAGTMRA